MARPPTKELTERELEVMHSFWDDGEGTAAEVRDRLAAAGVRMEVPPELRAAQSAPGPLTGKTYVLTGTLSSMSREQATEALRQGYAFFEGATLPAARGLTAALAAATGVLAGGDEPAVVVWNTLSWPRGAKVALDLPVEWVETTTTVVDQESGQSIPVELGPGEGGQSLPPGVAARRALKPAPVAP